MKTTFGSKLWSTSSLISVAELESKPFRFYVNLSGILKLHSAYFLERLSCARLQLHRTVFSRLELLATLQLLPQTSPKLWSCSTSFTQTIQWQRPRSQRMLNWRARDQVCFSAMIENHFLLHLGPRLPCCFIWRAFYHPRPLYVSWECSTMLPCWLADRQCTCWKHFKLNSFSFLLHQAKNWLIFS